MEIDFKNSKRITWTTLISVWMQIVLQIFFGDAQSANVLVAAIPAQIILVGGWTGISNWSELRHNQISGGIK